MRRDASREGLKHFRAALQPPPSPVPTLASIQRHTPGKWVWVCCAAYGCTHHAPMAIAPFIIRWGPHISSDTLRRSARCSKCGHRGATLQHPSYVNSVVGFQPFPAGQPTHVPQP